MVQDDPMLANIEKRLRESKKHTPAGGGMQQDDIITWVNARIIACTRLTDILWVLFPEQTKYPLLFEFLKPALKSSDLDLINVELDSASLRQEWLEFADRLQLKFTPENAQKAREIYLRYGLTEEDIELRKASLLSRSVIIQSLTTSQQTQKEFLSQFYYYLTSHKLAVFFQEHSIENLKLLVKDDCSLLEKILQVKSHSNILCDYFLANLHQFTLLENLYSADELLKIIIKTANTGMLKLMIAFGRDITPEEEQQYANCYPEVKKLLQHSLKILLTGKSFLHSMLSDSIHVEFSTYLDIFISKAFDKQLLILHRSIASLGLFFKDLQIETILNEKDIVVFGCLKCAIQIGNLDFVKRCVESPSRKYLLHLVYICAIFFERYDVIEFILDVVSPELVGQILLYAMKQENVTIMNLCLQHRFNLTNDNSGLISEVEEQFSELIDSNIILKQEFVKYNLVVALLKTMSIKNLSAYFSFLINNNKLAELLSPIANRKQEDLILISSIKSGSNQSSFHRERENSYISPSPLVSGVLDSMPGGKYYSVFELLFGHKEDFGKFLSKDCKKNSIILQNSILFKLAEYSFVYNDKSMTFLELAHSYGADWFVFEYIKMVVSKFGVIEGLSGNVIKFDIEHGQQTLLTWVLSQNQENYKKLIFEYLYDHRSEFYTLEELYSKEILLDNCIKYKNTRLLQLLLAFGRPLEEGVVLAKYSMYSQFTACHSKSIQMHLRCYFVQKDVFCALYDEIDILTEYLQGSVDLYNPENAIKYGYFDPNNLSILNDPSFLFEALLVGNTQVFDCYIEQFGIRALTQIRHHDFSVRAVAIDYNQYEVFEKISAALDLYENTSSFVSAFKKMDKRFLDIIVRHPVNLVMADKTEIEAVLMIYDHWVRTCVDLSLSPLILKEINKCKILHHRSLFVSESLLYFNNVQLCDKERGIYDENAPFKNIDFFMLKFLLNSKEEFSQFLLSDYMQKRQICYTETVLYKLSNTVCDDGGNIGLYIAYSLNVSILIDLCAQLETVSEIADENKYTTLGLAFRRLNDMNQSSELRLREQEIITQLIKKMDRCSEPMCKSNPDWLPIHAAIQCQSSLILTTILQKDITSIFANYQNRTPVFMVLQQYATMPIKLMKLMLYILNKHGADFRQNQAELCDMLRDLEQIVSEEEKKIFNDIRNFFPDYVPVRPGLNFFMAHEIAEPKTVSSRKLNHTIG